MAMIRLTPIDRSTLLQQVNRTAHRVQIPADFDPINETGQRIASFGLPPRPDRSTEPELYRFWTEMFSPPLTFVKGDLAYKSHSNFATTGAASQMPRQQSSRNWSG